MGSVTAVMMDVITEKSGHTMTGLAVSVCLTPAAPSPLPLPYPTVASVSEGVIDECLRTKIDGAKVLTVGSCTKNCHGNEPGTLKEVVSLNTAGPSFPIIGAPIVFIELGMAGITLSPGFMNKNPIPGIGGSASGAGGGGGGGGGAGGSGAGPGGGSTQGPSNSGGGGGGNNSAAAPPNAPAPPGADGQATASHPIDVVTGALVTSPSADFMLPGFLTFTFTRHYSSASVQKNVGLGFGWTHNLSYSARKRGDLLTIRMPHGQEISARAPADDETLVMAHGARLHKKAGNFILEKGDGRYYVLGPAGDGEYLLSQVRDAFGNLIEPLWDGDRLAGIIDSVGRTAVLRRDGRYLRWEITATPAGGAPQTRIAATYEIDERGDLVRHLDAGGAEMRFAYDDEHYLVEERHPDGLVYRFEYAVVGGQKRCVEGFGELISGDILEALGSPERNCRGLYHAKLTYEPEIRRTIVTDALGQRHIYEGNELGLVSRYTDPRGYDYRYQYDSSGKLLQIRDGSSRVTRLGRSPGGSLVSTVLPDGAEWREKRNAETGDIEHTRPDGRKESVRLAKDRVVLAKDAAGRVFQKKWNERGLLVSEIAPGGGKYLYEYDAHGNVRSIETPTGLKTEYTSDLFGCPVRVKGLHGVEYELSYDSRFDLVKIAHEAKVTEFGIDAARNLTAKRDATGTTFYRYVAGALVEQVLPSGQRWRFGYDALKRLRWITNPAGERYERDYDGSGLLSRELSFSGVLTTYERDGTGFVVAVHRGDGTWIRYQRDGEGRPTQVETSGGLKESFEYDRTGNLARTTNGTATVTFERDERGRIVREVTIAGGHRFEVSRRLDEAGNIIGSSYSTGWGVDLERRPEDGAVMAVRIAGAEPHELSYERDARGFELGRHWTQGERSFRFDRDSHGLPERLAIRNAKGETLRERTFRFGALGPAEEVADSRLGARRFELDTSGRPLSVSGLGVQEKYVFSPQGTPVPLGRDWQVGPGGRPIATASERLEWDARGRLAARTGQSPSESWRYGYDEHDRLLYAARGDGLALRYLYDPLGRCLAQTTNDGRSTWYCHDGDIVVEEVGTNGTVQRVFAEDGFSPLFEGTDQRAFRLVATDAAGTPFSYLGADGSESNIELGPWGAVARSEGSPGALRFAGQRADALTGLYHNRHRFYDPRLHVFTTPDPLGIDASPQEIGFVPNVTIYVDPSGLTIIVVGSSRDPATGRFRDPALNTGADALQRYNPTARVMAYDELTPGCLAGDPHIIVHTHGDPGRLGWGNRIVNGQQVGQELHLAGVGSGHVVDVYACNSATPAQGGGPSSTQAIANETGTQVRGARSNDPAATYAGTETPLRSRTTGTPTGETAEPGVLAYRPSEGFQVHDGSWHTDHPRRSDGQALNYRDVSSTPGLPTGPVPPRPTT